MKTFLLFFAATTLACGLCAQTAPEPESKVESVTTNTNNPAAQEPSIAAASPLVSTNEIEIVSDYGELRTETNYTAVYTGNVRATYGEASLTCNTLTILSKKNAERPDQMIADRNVVINHKDKDGKPIHATGDRAVYTFNVENLITNEVIVLSGDAKIDSQSGLITGDVVTWNLGTGIVNVSRQRTVIRVKEDAELPFGTSRTNAP